ncbi:MAG: TfoX/Sxy family protein [Saprospiraceae bacterium]|nr:TfoX/Sxy family protein [Saprospiraceae bacterium]
MAYSELLADRIRQILADKGIATVEKKMMGGLCFMVDDKMCLGVIKEELMARIGPDAYEAALEKAGSRAMDFTGRPMKGYVFVEPEGIDMDKDLSYWIQACLDFNPLAKSSKKKKKTKK